MNLRVSMPGIYGRACLDVTPAFKVGDPEPEGYIARQEWAQVHLDAGLKQEKCNSCCLYFFPHQLSETIFETPVIVTQRGKLPRKDILKSRRCLKCEAKSEARKAALKI